jgi:hypothetical protein
MIILRKEEVGVALLSISLDFGGKWGEIHDA